jgi:hypothetical protein
MPRRYLQELGLKFETVRLDLSKQEHKAETYLEVGDCLLAPFTIRNTMLACCTCCCLLCSACRA